MPEFKIDKYVLGQKLGKGATGVTRVGIDPNSGERIAIKIIYLDVNERKRRERIRAFETEIKMLERVKHENVLRLLFAKTGVRIPQSNGSTKDAIVLGLELATNGELMDHLLQTGKFTEEIGRKVFQSLVAGLEACHAAGIAHRDLKPENILLDNNFVVKIADFGFSRFAPQNGMETHVGTPAYMAPEVLAGIPYNKKADIWSLGVILFIILAGYPPYSSPSSSDYWWHALVTNRNVNRFWEGHLQVAKELDLSAGVRDLLDHLLEVSVRNRYGLEEIKNHQWAKKKAMSQEDLKKVLKTRIDDNDLASIEAKFASITLSDRKTSKEEITIFRAPISGIEKEPKNVLAPEILANLKEIRKVAHEKKELISTLPSDLIGGVRIAAKGQSPIKTVEFLADLIDAFGREVTRVEAAQIQDGFGFEVGLKNEKEISVQLEVYSDGENSAPIGGRGNPKDGLERRIDIDDKKAYTLDEFQENYGPMEGEELWEKAPPVPAEGAIVVLRRLEGNWRYFGQVTLRMRKRIMRLSAGQQE